MLLHQLNISKFVNALGQKLQVANAEQRYKPRDYWTRSETKTSLKYSHLKAQVKNSSQDTNHYRQEVLSAQELYKLYLDLIS